MKTPAQPQAPVSSSAGDGSRPRPPRLAEERRLAKVVGAVLLLALTLSLTVPAIRARLEAPPESPGTSPPRERIPASVSIHIAPLPPGGLSSGPPWPGRQPFRYGDRAAPPETPFSGLIHAAARRHDLDPGFVAAVIEVESAFDPHARSPKGAVGLMQLLPSTARRYGLDAADLEVPAKNIDAGTRHLRDLASAFGRDPDRVLAAYNAGASAVQRYRGVPPYPETREYVRRVRQAVATRGAGLGGTVAGGSGG